MRLQAEEDLLTLAAWRQAQIQRNALANAGEGMGLVGPGGASVPLHHVVPHHPLYPGPLPLPPPRHQGRVVPDRSRGFQTVVPHPLAIPGSRHMHMVEGEDGQDSMSDSSPMLAPHRAGSVQHSPVESRSVRMNIAGTVLSGQVGAVRSSPSRPVFGAHKLFAWFITIIDAPLLLTTVVVLALTNVTPTCERPVRFWVQGSAVRCILEMVCAWSTAVLPSPDGPFDRCTFTGFFASIRGYVTFLSRVWFILGCVWLFSAESCGLVQPHLYRTGLAVVTIQFFEVFMPCICLFLLVPVAFCCLPFFIRIMQRLQGPVPGRGATQAQLQTIPTEQYREGTLDSTQTTCAVCLMDYEAGDELRVLPCQHRFHARCVDDWLQLNATCPQCRSAVVPGAATTTGARAPTVQLPGGGMPVVPVSAV